MDVRYLSREAGGVSPSIPLSSPHLVRSRRIFRMGGKSVCLGYVKKMRAAGAIIFRREIADFIYGCKSVAVRAGIFLGAKSRILFLAKIGVVVRKRSVLSRNRGFRVWLDEQWLERDVF